MFRTLVIAVMVASLLPGCATVKSRDLSPNGVNPRVEGEAFFRGDDELLDEQEYYQLVGDRESYDAIRGPRAGAEAAQYVWGTTMLLGAGIFGFGAANVLLPVGGPLGDQGLFQPIIPSELNFLSYAIVAVGATLFGVSIGLQRSAYAKVNPTERMFPMDHAIAAAAKVGIDATLPAPNSEAYRQLMEERKAKAAAEAEELRRQNLNPKDVARVMIDGRYGERPSDYCHNGGDLTVKLFDAAGKELDFLEPRSLVTWESEPAGFVTPEGEYSSPVKGHLENLGTTLVIRAKVTATGVTDELKLPMGESCNSVFAVAGGRDGRDGESGEGGRYGNRDRPNGERGRDGAPGGNGSGGGGEVEVEAAFVKDRNGRSYVLVAGPGGRWDVFDGTALVRVSGGSGGRGGSGGAGGRGHTTSQDCESPGDGGDGGNGAAGGDGADGPDVKGLVASAAVAKRVTFKSEGGAAGKGGSGGQGGFGETSNWCKALRESLKGRGGKAGRDGKDGRPGRDGSVDVDVVPAAKLRRIQALLKEAPQVRLDDDGLDDAPGKSKKR